MQIPAMQLWSKVDTPAEATHERLTIQREMMDRHLNEPTCMLLSVKVPPLFQQHGSRAPALPSPSAREPRLDSSLHTWMDEERVRKKHLFRLRRHLSHLHSLEIKAQHERILFKRLRGQTCVSGRWDWPSLWALTCCYQGELRESPSTAGLHSGGSDDSVFRLFHRNKENTQRSDASVQTAGLLAAWQEKPGRASFFCLCWLSPADLTLCCSAFFFSSALDAPLIPADTQGGM